MFTSTTVIYLSLAWVGTSPNNTKRGLTVTQICYTLITKLWDVYFGKLSHIPGPKLAAATRLVLARYRLTGTAEAWKMTLHRKYGDVLRVAPNEISFIDGAVWKDVYGFANGSHFANMKKEPIFYSAEDLEPSMIEAEDLSHHRQRKCFNNAFSDKSLREQEPLIQNYISKLVSNIKNTTKLPTKQGIDISRQYNYTTFDIMADLMFGEPLGCLEKSEYVEWITMIFASMKLFTYMQEAKRIPFFNQMYTKLLPKSLLEKKKQHDKFAADRVDLRLSKSRDRPDIMHFVLGAEKKDYRLTRGEMHSNASLLMIGGSETSATLLSALTFYLLKRPLKMKLLTQEIRDRFSSADQICAQDLTSLKYLTACIWEALRMHPPVPAALPRLTPKGGAELCGYHVPENIIVHIHQLSMFRSPNNFAHSDSFLPQRWLPRNEEQYQQPDVDPADFERDDKSCLQPFSVGPRSCIGQSLAWIEIRLIISHILWHFDLELCEESQDWDDKKIYTLWTPKPLNVIATPVAR